MIVRSPAQWSGLGRALRPSNSSIRCSRCRITSQLPSRTPAVVASRQHIKPFSSSSPCLKKTGKANRAQARTASSPPVSDAGRGTAVDDAYDFGDLETNIMKAMEQLTHEMSQLRAGGRFNPEKIEQLKVELHSEDGTKCTERVKDLAQVVAKGRNVQVMVHDPDHVKKVNTAIVTSTLNLTPHGPAADAPMTLTIQVPPPTGESRMQALEAADKAAEAALAKIREARGKNQKKLRALGIAKTVRPDDSQKAQKMMEDVVKRGNDEVKKVLEDVKRVLERS